MRLVRITSVLALAGIAAWSALPGGGLAVAQTASPAGATATTAPAFAAEAKAVTLITGDTVRVSNVAGQTAVAVDPGPGREKVPFVTAGAGDNVRVVPGDAAGLLAAGRLDERLFDVSTLLKFGYDDTRRTLPLLIQGTAKPAGAKLTRALPDVGITAYAQDRSAPADLWKSLTDAGKLRSGVSKVWLDGLRKPTLDVSVPMIGAPAAWQAGLTGAGTKVAVIDTGIDLNHPDLAGQVTETADFTGTDLTDAVGHGTHVASTIAGTGAASGGKYRGVAPGAKLLDAKVCVFEGCPDSAILAGMNWAAEHGADIANMSLGGSDTPGIDPLEAAVHDLTAKYGTLFVVAAGNEGDYGDVTINSPGSADEALTVGAVSKTKTLAEFSSRGPRSADAAVKPDITAPGVAIVAARSADGTFGPIDGNDAYTSLSGTSMATPHVAGAAALLAQQHPDWRPAQLKSTLTAAASPSDDLGPYEQGAGLVDVARGITQTVTSDPVSVGFERGTSAQTRTITYANSAATPVTLNLAIRSNAPAGLFQLSASTVTVPAGGTAAVTLTAQATATTAAESFGGQVVATSGTTRVETPIAMDIARHTLTIHTPGGSGDDQVWATLITDLDDQKVSEVDHVGESAQIRLPSGRYVVESYLFTGSPQNPQAVTMLADPAVTLTADRTITMDVGNAKPMAITVPDKKAIPAYGEVGWTIRTKKPEIWGSNDPFSALMNVPLAAIRTGPATGSGKADGFVSYVSASWAQTADGTNLNCPAVYRAYFYERGRMLAGKKKDLRRGDLAEVRSQVGADVPGVPVERVSVPRAPGNSPVYSIGGERRASPLAYFYDAPRTVVEYFNRDQDAEWGTTNAQKRYTYYDSGWVGYQPGRTYHVKWADGITGPVFPQPDFDQQFATRYWGDTIGGPGPLHGDSSGHEGFRAVRDGSVDVRLYRNGTQVGSANETPQAFDVPAEAGDYRLHATFHSSPEFTLSTLVDAEWTFRSGHVAEQNRTERLPLTAIRFTPDLDVNHTAGAGRALVLPISLDRQVGAAKASTRSLTVEASFDDGKTWHRVPAVRTGEKAIALIQNPRGTGYASLRASAADSAGNTVRQTIIHAYRYQ
nr:S8 family serine peptidase [uncultured Actinoplanes sp.]